MSPATVLVACEAFAEGMDATRTAQAIGRGLRAGDPELETDLCPLAALPLEALPHSPAALPADFDARMRRARAVIVAAERLDHETLLRGLAVFEAATRARQNGVPCYALAGCNALDLFEARILDLQVVLGAAGGTRALTSAGRRLAGMVC